MEVLEYQGEKIHRWQAGASTFLARPEAGARLMNWHLSMADGSTRDVIYWPVNDDLSNLAKVRGGNPILFPFCGRSYDGGEIGYWKAQDGIRQPMPMHGFARAGVFEIENLDERGFTAVYCPCEKDRECYPYQYQFAVIYRFHELSLDVELRLSNQDDKDIPWSAGHHFYFQLPWQPSLTREDYRIQIPARKAFSHARDGRLMPEEKLAQNESFGSNGLLDRIYTDLSDNRVAFGPEGGKEGISLHIGTDTIPPPYHSIVTWTERPDSPFYCIEPWMGPPNSPEHKNGLHYVEPGKTEAFSVEVSLS